MSDEPGGPADAGDAETGSPGEGEDGDEDEAVAPGLSDDGIMLFFAGAASLLAATTVAVTGQPLPIAVVAAVAGGMATVAFVVDLATDVVPDNRIHLAVGAAALLGALLSLPGRDWVNVATLGAAAALVLWRVIDTRFRGAER